MTIQQLAARLWLPRVQGRASSDYGSALTEQTIAATERKLGLKLPADYLEFMRYQNGGELSLESGEIDGLLVDLRSLGGLGTPNGPEEKGAYLVGAWRYPQPSVYLCGDGRAALIFDYRGVAPEGPPVITWVDAEMEDERPAVAMSFTELLQRLLDAQ